MESANGSGGEDSFSKATSQGDSFSSKEKSETPDSAAAPKRTKLGGIMLKRNSSIKNMGRRMSAVSALKAGLGTKRGDTNGPAAEAPVLQEASGDTSKNSICASPSFSEESQKEENENEIEIK